MQKVANLQKYAYWLGQSPDLNKRLIAYSRETVVNAKDGQMKGDTPSMKCDALIAFLSNIDDYCSIQHPLGSNTI